MEPWILPASLIASGNAKTIVLPADLAEAFQAAAKLIGSKLV